MLDVFARNGLRGILEREQPAHLVAASRGIRWGFTGVRRGGRQGSPGIAHLDCRRDILPLARQEGFFQRDGRRKHRLGAVLTQKLIQQLRLFRGQGFLAEPAQANANRIGPAADRQRGRGRPGELPPRRAGPPSP